MKTRTVLAGLLVLAATACDATTYYIDEKAADASDDNAGTRAAPWKSLEVIRDKTFSPGDTVVVKPGIYKVGGTAWSKATAAFQQDGTKKAPLTLKCEEHLACRVDASGQPDPVLGSRNADWVIIDGFEVFNSRGTEAGAHPVRVYEADHITIQNMWIHDVSTTHESDNTTAINIEGCEGCLVRNNKLGDITNADAAHNAAGIMSYYSKRLVTQHNEIYNVPTGIYDKRGGQSNEHRKNWIHDCTGGEHLSFLGWGSGGSREGDPEPQGNLFTDNALGGGCNAPSGDEGGSTSGNIDVIGDKVPAGYGPMSETPSGQPQDDAKPED